MPCASLRSAGRYLATLHVSAGVPFSDVSIAARFQLLQASMDGARLGSSKFLAFRVKAAAEEEHKESFAYFSLCEQGPEALQTQAGAQFGHKAARVLSCDACRLFSDWKCVVCHD